jgi:4-hydroxy-4-methyl-2-oxoglutarate aldolase
MRTPPPMNQLPDIVRDFERVSSELVRQALATFQPAILADVAGRRGACTAASGPAHTG